MLQRNGVGKIKTHILCSITFFFENRAIYEIMWENMRSACCVTLQTHTQNI